MRSQLSEKHQISVHELFAPLNFIISPHLALATSRTTARGMRDTALVGDMRRIVSATPASWCCVATWVSSQRMEALKDAMNMRNVPSDTEAAAAAAAAAADVVLFCKPANESAKAPPPTTAEAAVSLALPAPAPALAAAPAAPAAVPAAALTISSFQRAMRAPTTTPSTATASVALRGTRRHAKDTRKVQKMAEDLGVSWGRRCGVEVLRR